MNERKQLVKLSVVLLVWVLTGEYQPDSIDTIDII